MTEQQIQRDTTLLEKKQRQFSFILNLTNHEVLCFTKVSQNINRNNIYNSNDNNRYFESPPTTEPPVVITTEDFWRLYLTESAEAAGYSATTARSLFNFYQARKNSKNASYNSNKNSNFNNSKNSSSEEEFDDDYYEDYQYVQVIDSYF